MSALATAILFATLTGATARGAPHPVSAPHLHSMSKACRGYLNVCHLKDHETQCEDQFFYLYAYQSVSLQQKTLVNRDHLFSLNGALDDEEDKLKFVGSNGPYLLYRGLEFDFAIPYEDHYALMARQIPKNAGPESVGWQILCQ